MIIHGDCLETLKTLEDNSIDAVVTDPPYGLSFMGKKWDYDVPSTEIWEECLRVLKPGGYLLAFAGTRTQHRMAVRIEDAGFEIRDMIAWVYGSGFPKSLNIGKAVDKLQGNEREVVGIQTNIANRGNNNDGRYNWNTENQERKESIDITKGTSEWEGWGTALKPAHEPICMAQKPKDDKFILDACCGGKMFWFDKNHPNTLYIDKRTCEKGHNKTKPNHEVKPDMLMDFTDLQFADKTFNMVVFDPPHLFLGENSKFAKDYGTLKNTNWEEDIKKGFLECFRVLKDYGVLIFKWNEFDIPVDKILSLTDVKPLFGQRSGKQGKTHWISFMKIPEGQQQDTTPAHEPICMARKPLAEKNVAENCLKWGVGGINIDATRIPSYINGDNSESIVPLHKLFELRHKLYTLLFSFVVDKKDYQIPSSVSEYVLKWKELKDCLDGCSIYLHLYDELTPLFQEGDQVSFQQLHDAHDGIYRFRQEQTDSLLNQDTDHLSSLDDFLQLILTYIKVNDYTNNDTTPDIKSQGRFPANLILDGSDEVLDLFPNSKSTVRISEDKDKKQNTFSLGRTGTTPRGHNDSGSAARFFYCAKASKAERNRGCEGLEEKRGGSMMANTGETMGLGGASLKGEPKEKQPDRNNHPTVKPIALMEYLVKLVSREGATVLDPFAGSGTTGIACKNLNRQFIGIEREEDYVKIANARINAKV